MALSLARAEQAAAMFTILDNLLFSQHTVGIFQAFMIARIFLRGKTVNPDKLECVSLAEIVVEHDTRPDVAPYQRQRKGHLAGDLVPYFGACSVPRGGTGGTGGATPVVCRVGEGTACNGSVCGFLFVGRVRTLWRVGTRRLVMRE